MIVTIVVILTFSLGALAGVAGIKNNDSELRILGAVWMAASVVIGVLG